MFMSMELSRHSGAADIGPLNTMRPLYWMLVVLSLVPLVIVLPMASTKVAIATILGWTSLIWIAISFARGQFLGEGSPLARRLFLGRSICRPWRVLVSALGKVSVLKRRRRPGSGIFFAERAGRGSRDG